MGVADPIAGFRRRGAVPSTAIGEEAVMAGQQQGVVVAGAAGGLGQLVWRLTRRRLAGVCGGAQRRAAFRARRPGVAGGGRCVLGGGARGGDQQASALFLARRLPVFVQLRRRGQPCALASHLERGLAALPGRQSDTAFFGLAAFVDAARQRGSPRPR